MATVDDDELWPVGWVDIGSNPDGSVLVTEVVVEAVV